MATNIPVKFIKIPRDKLATLPIKEGQLIFVTDTNKLYLDETNSSRIQIDGKDFSYGLTIDGNTIGIQKDGGNATINIPECIPISDKGANNGVAELDNTGKVPSTQLPSYVDDVIEAASYSALPETGETGKIYVTLDNNKTYRWSGSTYVEISESLALGETSSTAYRGDRGKIAYDHSQTVHAPAAAQENIIETIKLNGNEITPDTNKAVNIIVPTNISSFHIIENNSSSNPFIITENEPGIYIIKDSQPDQIQTRLYYKYIDSEDYAVRSETYRGLLCLTDTSVSEVYEFKNIGYIFDSSAALAHPCVTQPAPYGASLASASVGVGNTLNSVVRNVGNQTISGIKTFNDLPQSSIVPTADNQFTNKKYVDDLIGDINTVLATLTTPNNNGGN